MRNLYSGRRDGGLGQRIYNEVRRIEGTQKEKEARTKLNELWQSGAVTWKSTQRKVLRLTDKISSHRMAEPLEILNHHPKPGKLAFQPRKKVRPAKLTKKDTRFLENQFARKKPATSLKRKRQHFEPPNEVSAHVKKHAVSLEGVAQMKPSQGATQCVWAIPRGIGCE